MESRKDQDQIVFPLMGLPDLPLANVFSFLSPETLLLVVLVSQRFKQFSRNESLWGNKIRQHFFESAPEVPLFRMFWETYKVQYPKKLIDTPEKLQLFSLIKEGDVEGIINNKKLSLWDFLIADVENHLVLYWARKKGIQKKILNHVYQLAYKEYEKDDGQVDTQKIDGASRTILFWAIICLRPMEEILSLIKQGSSFDELYLISYFYPIHVASHVNHLELIQSLFDGENDLAQLQKINKHNQTPLMYAAMGGSEAVIRFLLQKIGALEKNDLLKARGGFDGKQVIHYASIEGNVAIVEMLIRQNPSLLNEKDNNGMTPLAFAITFKRNEIIDFLLGEKNLEIDAYCQNNIDPRNKLYLKR